MAKATKVAMAALTSSVAAADPTNFYSDGTSFYAQVFSDNTEAQHYYIDVGLGCDKVQQKWFLTTLEESVGYTTSICSEALGCDVSDKFAWASQTSNPAADCLLTPETLDQTMFNENAHLPDGTDKTFLDPLPSTQVVQGYRAANLLNFENTKYAKEQTLQMKLLAIMQVNNIPFKSETYSGYMGLAPYSSSAAANNENIISQIKQAGWIDHAQFSIYLQKDGVSLIKFGSYDPAAVEDSADLEVFRTKDLETWTIQGQQVKAGTAWLDTGDVNVLMDPHLPFIYTPTAGYTAWKTEVEKLYGTAITCDTADRPCYFSTACNAVPDADISFQVSLKDQVHTKTINIPKTELLIDGTLTGDSDRCYLGVYELASSSDTYYLGSPFYNTYYVSYSLDAWVLDNSVTYNQIGIGRLSTTACVGDISGLQCFLDNLNKTTDEIIKKITDIVVTGQYMPGCNFGNPDWEACLVTNWWYPAVFASITAFIGLWMQATTQWGFWATMNTPDIQDSFTNGHHNVWVAWYVADSQISAFYELLEGSTMPFLMLTYFGLIIYHNINGGNYYQPYFAFGITAVVAAVFYIANNSTLMAYDVLNTVYLQSRYDPDTWVTLAFGTFWNMFGDSAGDDTLIVLNYIEQLLIGNKRLALYNNFMMATVACFHPITLPFGALWLAQLPFQLVLDGLIYIIFPEFDTPQLPFYEFFD